MYKSVCRRTELAPLKEKHGVIPEVQDELDGLQLRHCLVTVKIYSTD